MSLNKFINNFPAGKVKDNLLISVEEFFQHRLEEAFYIACQQENIEKINQFIDYGYDIIHIDSEEGHSALLHHALHTNNIDMIMLYIGRGGLIRPEDFEEICEHSNLEFVKKIVEEFNIDDKFIDMVKDGIKSATKAENYKVMLFLMTILAQNNTNILEMISEVFK